MENQIDSTHEKTLSRYLMYAEKTNKLIMDSKRWQKEYENDNRRFD